MRGLFSDRFLRKFAGELKNRRKNQNSTGEGNNPEAEEACEEAGAASAGVHTNDVPTKAEPNEQDEGGPKAD